ncbi:MAG: class I SAM-dependent methyltransferase [Lentisphaerae bacterium]|nr:class I SAM-dependent methyltransferase [Lentisphaerota bacterium]
MTNPSSEPDPAPRPAEFDAYAKDYDAGMDNPLKRRLGDSAASFIEIKTRWLLKDLARNPPYSCGVFERQCLLDFGCGTGTALRSLRTLGYPGRLAGCDVSEKMLAEASEKWTTGTQPEWRVVTGNRPEAAWQAPFPDDHFDIVIASSVLHHVEPAQRQTLYSEFRRLLKPGGRVYIFEHNPWNPITRWVVRHTKIDENAVLLPAPETLDGLRCARMARRRAAYMLFFPPRWSFLLPLESLLDRVPLGGQYAAAANKPD